MLPIKDWLMSAAGAAYLTQEYVLNERSTYELAREKGTYAKLISRALVFHGLARRDKGTAQSSAIKCGRHPHPTKGKPRSVDDRNSIRKGVQDAIRDKQSGFPLREC